MRLLFAYCSTVVALAGWGCTEPNPGFTGGGRDAGGQAEAAPPAPDGAPGDGGSGTLDGPLPDVVPGVCGSDAECDDQRPCTADRCNVQQQRCENTLAAGFCLIRGTCRRQAEVDPQDSCRFCNPAADTMAWSARDDGTPCADDQLACTEDVCKAGTCAHRVTGCLIGGACYDKGGSPPGDACQECLPAKSQQSFSFVDGKPCAPPAGSGALAGICTRAACRALVETGFDTTLVGALPGASLTGVAEVPGGGIWAVVRYRLGELEKGAILQLPPTGLGSVVLTAQPMRAIHHRLAIGAGGAIYRHGTTGWKQSKQFENAIGLLPRHAVWGVDLGGGQERYLLAGEESADGESPGILSCDVAATGWPSCTAHEGFEGTPLIGAVWGTGAQGPAWAISTGQWEDIYYRAPNATAWTSEAPHGCYDTPGNPCHNPASGAFSDLHASGPADAWVVGSGGLLLRYDGAWHSLAGTPAGLPAYALDAVLSARADNLLVIAARFESGGQRHVALFTYNFDLDRWFGPITVAQFAPDGPGRLFDIAQAQGGTLWIVGERPLPVYGKILPMGWALRLQ